jgi:hypothetical protein
MLISERANNGVEGFTLNIVVVHIKEGKMVSIWDGEQGLCRIRFSPLIIRSNPYIRDCNNMMISLLTYWSLE